MEITGVTLKQFISRKFNIPQKFLRVTASGNYAHVRIIPDKLPATAGKELVYSHHFPKEFGNLCMNVVYKGSEKLCSQDWGGNICQHSIAMHHREWQEVIDFPLTLSQGS